MTVRGKPGKPKTGFPPFPPPLEIAARFPHSHRFDSSSYIRRRRTLVRQKPPHLRINDLEVGQNKLPKWAEYSCQTQQMFDEEITVMTRWQAGAILISVLFFAGTLVGQVSTPDSGLTFSGLIQVPNWTTSAAGVDLSSYDPVNQVLYYADRVAHGVLAIDTKTNSVLGWVP